MNIRKSISILAAAGALAGAVFSAPVAHACTSPSQTTWGLDSSCTDQTTTGFSKGLFSPLRVRATLIFGSKAEAQGFTVNGTFVCGISDTSANGSANGVNSAACPASAVRHRVIVTP
jgi:hypothetical protein